MVEAPFDEPFILPELPRRLGRGAVGFIDALGVKGIWDKHNPELVIEALTAGKPGHPVSGNDPSADDFRTLMLATFDSQRGDVAKKRRNTVPLLDAAVARMKGYHDGHPASVAADALASLVAMAKRP